MILLDSLLTSLPLRSLCDSLGDQIRPKLHLLKYTLTQLDCGEADDQTIDIKSILNEENLLFLGETLRSHASFLDHTVFDRVTGPQVDASLPGTLQNHVRIIHLFAGILFSAHMYVQVKVTMTTVKLLCQFTQYEKWLLSVQRHYSASDILRSSVGERQCINSMCNQVAVLATAGSSAVPKLILA